MLPAVSAGKCQLFEEKRRRLEKLRRAFEKRGESKMKKTILMTLVAAVFAVSFSACSNTGTTSNTQQTASIDSAAPGTTGAPASLGGGDRGLSGGGYGGGMGGGPH
jgi:uncharacterized membrane protein